jgi:hypothetical protein
MYFISLILNNRFATFDAINILFGQSCFQKRPNFSIFKDKQNSMLCGVLVLFVSGIGRAPEAANRDVRI